MNIKTTKKASTSIVLILLIASFLFCSPKAYAQSIDEKPLFVTISTQWCYACKILKPVIEELKKEYGDRVTFVDLDPTSEETLAQSMKIAEEYGITQFFNSSRNAFPTVGILCSSNTTPEKIIVGANQKQSYKEILDKLLVTNEGICSLNTGRPEVGVSDSENRQEEPEIASIPNARPPEPNFLDRPKEAITNGRPPELSFWTVGQQIPYYAYNQYIVLPGCSSSNSVLCGSGSNINKIASQTDDTSTFKPYDPNYTRDEKGLKLKPKKGQ